MPVQGIQSRLATALIFSYVGNQHQVPGILQKLSHRTRAYIVNADGLKGFLIRLGKVAGIIHNAERMGRLKEVLRWQQVEIKVVKKLLRNQKTEEGQLFVLKHKYPALHLYALKELGRTTEIRRYMAKCQTYEANKEKYFFYINGYWLPWLDQQRAEGKLKKGKGLPMQSCAQQFLFLIQARGE